ncbi:MAG TPA: methyltransferase domain-containing protein [Phaeodactylibacter sp.]|nr:methyltransferase domain-containing protein [Phaeodactylibacter sp.]
MNKGRLQHHTPAYENAVGQFGLPYHLEMIRDAERTGRICAALHETLKPHYIHCELGAGTGIFSIYAARRCKKVYAVEKDPAILEFARENIERAGLKNKIELIHEDALNFRPPQKADNLLVEMMSIWCINEPQVPVMNHALKHILKKDGQRTPMSITNLIELGHYDFGALEVECKASITQFTGITAPRIMTASHVFNKYDFSMQNPEEITQSIEIPILLSGTLNCARLSSLVQLSPGITFYSTDSLMPQTIVPLQNERKVKAGERIRLHASFKLRSNVDEMKLMV